MPYIQSLDTCTHCGVESAVVAQFDADHLCCLLGVAANSRCRLCGRETVGDVFPECEMPNDAEQRMLEHRCPACGDSLDELEDLIDECGSCGISASERGVRRGKSPGTVDELREALERWAAEEGRESAESFVAASFPDGSFEKILERIENGETIETRLDVLTPLLGAEEAQGSDEPDATDGEPAAEAVEEPIAVAEKNPAPVGIETADANESPAAAAAAKTTQPLEELPGSDLDIPLDHVAVRLLPLVSVMMADGRRHEGEEAFIQGILDAVHTPRIPKELFRYHPPSSLPVPQDPVERRNMVEAMVHLTHVDKRRSGYEMKVVRDFARAWDVPQKQVMRWADKYQLRYTSGPVRLLLLIRNAVQ